MIPKDGIRKRLNVKVDHLAHIHAPDERHHGAHDPVDVTQTAKQQIIIGLVRQFYDHKLIRAVQREQFDVAADFAGNVRIHHLHSLLERAGLLFQQRQQFFARR